MKKKKRNIPVYSDSRVTLSTTLTIEVDEAGDGWLTPEQTLYLENAHLWARYAYSKPFRATKHLVVRYELPIPEVDDATVSMVDRSLYWSTPVLNGATI